MAYSINKVTLLGNVGKDPEVRSFANGGKVASFSVATSDVWKDKTNGERKTKTEWHNVSVQSEGLVEVIKKHVKKGSKVHVEGKLETRSWEKDGVKHYATEIVLYPYSGEIIILDPKEEADDELPDQPAFDA